MENICTICGKSFVPTKFHAKIQKTCSLKCRKKLNLQNYYANKEDISVQRKKKYGLIRDKINASRREKYAEDSEKILKRNKLSYQKHKDKRRFYVSWVSQGHKERGVKFNDFILQFERKWEQQDGKCAICRNKFHSKGDGIIDHDHKTGLLRGLLCKNCNWGLGLFKDNKIIIEESIRYIQMRNQ